MPQLLSAWYVYNSVYAVSISQGMDIPDIEVVVVSGTPDTLAQLYQVAYIHHLKMSLYFRMFGRAGRNGCSA